LFEIWGRWESPDSFTFNSLKLKHFHVNNTVGRREENHGAIHVRYLNVSLEVADSSSHSLFLGNDHTKVKQKL
jgi:hypothetical protein